MRVRSVLCVVAVSAAVVAWWAVPAGARVGGSNGDIAFSRFDPTIGDVTTFVVSPAGGDPTALFPGVQTGAPHWSPDGSLLAIQAGLDNPCPPCAASTIVLDPATGTYRVLSPPDPGLSTDCAIWSPNGKRFACEVGSPDGNANGIYTIRTSDGLGLRQVTSNPGGDDVPIDYSPDGKRLVFGRLGQDHACTTTSALYVVNLDGTGLRRITPWGFCDDDGSWSPDGTTIVFEHLGSLFRVSPSGAGLQKISLKTGNSTTSFSAFDVSWSPDGTKLVFALRIRTDSGTTVEGIGSANSDGSDVRLLTTSPTRDSSADWGSYQGAISAP